MWMELVDLASAPMDLYEAIRRLVLRLDEAGLRYALIGGMAMAMRGVQ